MRERAIMRLALKGIDVLENENKNYMYHRIKGTCDNIYIFFSDHVIYTPYISSLFLPISISMKPRVVTPTKQNSSLISFDWSITFLPIPVPELTSSVVRACTTQHTQYVWLRFFCTQWTEQHHENNASKLCQCLPLHTMLTMAIYDGVPACLPACLPVFACGDQQLLDPHLTSGIGWIGLGGLDGNKMHSRTLYHSTSITRRIW